MATVPRPAGEEAVRGRRGHTTRRVAGLAFGAVLLLATAVASIAVGARFVPPSVVLDALLSPADVGDHVVIRELRVPRTILGLAVGAALGTAGTLMQSLTRNPLADPTILGVSQGAAFGVVIAISLLGIGNPAIYVWFAFAGAGQASMAVYTLGSGRSGATPVRLALAGIALGAVLHALSSALLRIDTETYERMRFWMSGSLAGQTADVIAVLVPIMVVGVCCALFLAWPLNALALGDDTGRALGAGVGRTRLLTGLAITVLAGAATAATGPIWFVGLAVPHAVRSVVGPDLRWVLPFSALFTPILLLGSDVVGRVLGSPGEVQAGIVCAVIGAPVFIALARRRKLPAL